MNEMFRELSWVGKATFMVGPTDQSLLHSTGYSDWEPKGVFYILYLKEPDMEPKVNPAGWGDVCSLVLQKIEEGF